MGTLVPVWSARQYELGVSRRAGAARWAKSAAVRATTPGLMRNPSQLKLLRPERLGDIGQSTPQTGPFEVIETEVAVEGGGSVVDRIHDDGPGSELSAASDAPAQGVDQKVTAQPVALLRAVEGQPGEHDDGNWVGHTTTQAGWRGGMRYGTYGEGVVPDDPRSATQDVGRCCSRSGGQPRRAHEPFVEHHVAAVEAFDGVAVC
jgi:hypothetical protein